MGGGADGLLELALTEAGIEPGSAALIIDGVRHVRVWEAVNRVAESPRLVYMAAGFEVRYARYSTLLGAPVSREEFASVNDHPIERGISDLQALATYTVDANRPLAVVLAEVEEICGPWLQNARR